MMSELIELLTLPDPFACVQKGNSSEQGDDACGARQTLKLAEFGEIVRAEIKQGADIDNNNLQLSLGKEASDRRWFRIGNRFD